VGYCGGGARTCSWRWLLHEAREEGGGDHGARSRETSTRSRISTREEPARRSNTPRPPCSCGGRRRSSMPRPYFDRCEGEFHATFLCSAGRRRRPFSTASRSSLLRHVCCSMVCARAWLPWRSSRHPDGNDEETRRA
jgi:hypothetical protein